MESRKLAIFANPCQRETKAFINQFPGPNHPPETIPIWTIGGGKKRWLASSGWATVGQELTPCSFPTPAAILYHGPALHNAFPPGIKSNISPREAKWEEMRALSKILHAPQQRSLRSMVAGYIIVRLHAQGRMFWGSRSQKRTDWNCKGASIRPLLVCTAEHEGANDSGKKQ